MDDKLKAAANSLDANREVLLKAHFVGIDAQPSNVISAEQTANSNTFARAGAIGPPYSPETLCILLEHSNALRQNIDAYITNIDGFGHTFVPVIDLDADDSDERIATAIFLERLHVAEQENGPDADVPANTGNLWPTPEDIDAKRLELRDLMHRELFRIKAFFEACCADSSFIALRRRTRQDIEIQGNGYWEVLRNVGSEVAQFVYMPAFTVRLMPLRNQDIVEVEIPVKVSELTTELRPQRRQFRRFVQITDGGRRQDLVQGTENVAVWFKELGDPRVMSKRTGEFFDSVESLKRKDPKDSPATEVFHFLIPNPRSAYGTPRWIGALLSVMGSRQAEEVNFLYFENKAVPPLAVLVSGGRMTEEAVTRVQEYVENEIKGKRNFHKILFLEADSEAAPGSGRTKIEIKPLTSAQHSDALFQNYDARNIDKVGMSFRLPRMLRGDVRDFNRSTAEAALEFAEMQVFQPEREDFDWKINHKIMSDLGVRFWKFQSRGPISKDPTKLAEIAALLVKNGILTPGEGRRVAEDVLNRDLPRIEAFWADQPLQISLAGFMPDEDGQGQIGGTLSEETRNNGTGNTSTSLEMARHRNGGRRPRRTYSRRPTPKAKADITDEAARLVKLRDEIRRVEADLAEKAFLQAKATNEHVPDAPDQD